MSTSTQKKIVVVDDDAACLRLLSIRLTAAGYEVIPVDNGKKALPLLSMTSPHLVITDLCMHDMDGLALLEAIHQARPVLPVIILTAYGSIADAVTATHRGVFSFMTKPYDSKNLLQQVANALRQRGDLREEGDGIETDERWREDIITCSPLMQELLAQAKLVAASEVSVFIHGSSGTGKELLAQAIHKASPRRKHAFVPVTCSAIPESLLESELFGYRKGAFTGATQDHAGLFQMADGGTVFLDEVGDMPLPLQAKLLRVLQEKHVRQVGSTHSTPVHIRLVSATHRDLEQAIWAGNFREDLYYRLHVVRLDIPDLSARREDIPLLARHFLTQLAALRTQHVREFAPEAIDLLVRAPWPGNVRQLRNVVEQTFALSTTPIIPASLVHKALRHKGEDNLSLTDAKSRFKRHYLVQLLQITGGDVGEAAQIAKLNRATLYKFIQRYKVNPSSFKTARV